MEQVVYYYSYNTNGKLLMNRKLEIFTIKKGTRLKSFFLLRIPQRILKHQKWENAFPITENAAQKFLVSN